jgi:hypothetical protein
MTNTTRPAVHPAGQLLRLRLARQHSLLELRLVDQPYGQHPFAEFLE